MTTTRLHPHCSDLLTSSASRPLTTSHAAESRAAAVCDVRFASRSSILQLWRLITAEACDCPPQRHRAGAACLPPLRAAAVLLWDRSALLLTLRCRRAIATSCTSHRWVAAVRSAAAVTYCASKARRSWSDCRQSDALHRPSCRCLRIGSLLRLLPLPASAGLRSPPRLQRHRVSALLR